MSIELNIHLGNANAAIAELRAMVNHEIECDTCDVADTIVRIVEACDLHHGGNLEGLILGIPGDYTDLISGLHEPDEDWDDNWDWLAPALAVARAFLVDESRCGAREAIVALDMLVGALAPNLAYGHRVGLMLNGIRDMADVLIAERRGVPDHYAVCAQSVAGVLAGGDFAIPLAPLTPAHTD
jgi:hypothetical protein